MTYSLKKIFYFILFDVLVLLRKDQVNCSKLLKLEKQFCKDLRDCQVYFPCSYFITGYIHPPQIQQCPPDFVFDEQKQECVQPMTREDFECLLLSKRPMNSRITSKPATLITTRKARKYLQNDLIANFERNFELVDKKNKTRSSKKMASLRKVLDDNLIEETGIDEIFDYETKTQEEEKNNRRESRRKALKKFEQIEEDEEVKKPDRKEKVDMNKENQTENNEEDSGEEEENSDIKDDDQYRRMCVVTNWSQFRGGRGRFQFEYINIHLCNHIIFSSVIIAEAEDTEDEEYVLKSVQHNDIELFAKLAVLKSRKPNIKTILRITDEGGRLYSKLSRKAETRGTFILNVMDFIDEHRFDGVELDWKWPAGVDGTPNDKQNFALLLKEFKNEMTSKYIIGITMSPLTDRIQKSYSLIDINNNVDYVNVECYDYYGPWDKRTGINAPLMKMDQQILTEAFMNIDGTVTFLKALGLSASKIILGIAAYGRSFILQDSRIATINAPTTGNGFSGSFTKINGLLSYYEVCEAKKKGKWQEEWEPLALTPYMHNDESEWVSYENEESIHNKIDFVKNNGLAGVSINSIDMDDFQGSFCGEGPYPLLRSSLGLLMKNFRLENVLSVPVKSRVIETKQNKKPKSSRIKSTTQKTTEASKEDIMNDYELESSTMQAKIKSNEKTPEMKRNELIQKEKKEMTSANKKYPFSKTQNKKTSKSSYPKKNSGSMPSQKITKSPVIKENKRVEVQASTSAYFLITPPPNGENHREPVSYSEKLISQELPTQEKVRTVIEKQQQLKINPQQEKLEQLRQNTQLLIKPIVETTKQTPYIEVQAQAAPSKTSEEWINELQKVAQEQEQRINQQLYHKNQLEEQQKQQEKEYEYHRQQQQQLELQQQQLKKQIAEREWQLQQEKHQYQEQLIKNLQYQQQKQNEQLNNVQAPQLQAAPPAQPLISQIYVTQPPPLPIAPQLPSIIQQAPSQPTSFVQPQVPASNHYNTWTQSLDNKCLGKNNGIYRDEFSCSDFYVCETNSRIHKFKCPNGLMFNMQDCTCDWPRADQPCVIPLFNSFCKETGPDTPSAPSTFQNSYVAQSTPAPVWQTPFSCQNKETGLHRDPFDCTRFYYCQLLTGTANGLVVIKHDFNCPSGLHFNLNSCQCDWPTQNGCNTNYFATLCKVY